MEEQLKEWFDGKTVAIVGNAKSLHEKNLGEEIDSHDLVCRINRSFNIVPPKTNKYVKHLGKKTDFYFINLVRTSKIPPKIANSHKIVQTSPGVPGGVYREYTDLPTDREKMYKFFENFKQKPSTGIRVIHLLSLCEPKFVRVYGFDWKQKSPSFFGDTNWNKINHNFDEEKVYCFKHYFNKENFEWIE